MSYDFVRHVSDKTLVSDIPLLPLGILQCLTVLYEVLEELFRHSGCRSNIIVFWGRDCEGTLAG